MKCEVCRKPIKQDEVLNKDYIRDSCPDHGGSVFHRKCLEEGPNKGLHSFYFPGPRGLEMKGQYELVGMKPGYYTRIPVWKCHKCGKVAEGKECSPAFHKCPAETKQEAHRHDVE